MTGRLRVIQWATGNVGKHSVEAVHNHPDLELVGALVYGDDKAGRDVGEIVGIGPIGVIATKDVDEILALDADCVLYMPRATEPARRPLTTSAGLLASGKNVVSTAVTALIYPAEHGHRDVVERLEAACDEGQSSFHATGIEPGWGSEVLPLTMSGLFRRIDSLLVQELMDYSTYDQPFVLFDVMGFGKPPDTRVPMDEPAIGALSFKAPLMLVAEGLGATIDDLRLGAPGRRRPTNPSTSRPAASRPAPFGACASPYTAIIDGRPALTVEHITRLRPDQAPDWPTGRGWKVTVEGLPSMVLESRIAIHGEDDTDQGCLGTAMHSVHAVAPVCAAEPGHPHLPRSAHDRRPRGALERTR